MFSCDPEDARLVFINNTKDSLVIRMMFDRELPNNPTYWNRSREIKVNSLNQKRVSIFNRWEGEFNRALPDTLINIIVTPYYDFEATPQRWDSLLFSDKSYFRKYSLKDLTSRDWTVRFPEDGFDKVGNGALIK